MEKAGYKLGDDIFFALDPASTEFFKDGKYVLEGEGKTLTPDQMVKVYADLCEPLSHHLHRRRHGRG